MAKKSELFGQIGFVGTCIVTGALALTALPGSLLGLAILGGGVLVAGGGGAIVGGVIGGAVDIATDMIKESKDPTGSPLKVLKNALRTAILGPEGEPKPTAAENGAMAGTGLGILAGYGLAIAGTILTGAALVPALSAAALVVVASTAVGVGTGWGVGKSIDIVKSSSLFDKKQSAEEVSTKAAGIDEYLPKVEGKTLKSQSPGKQPLPEKGLLKNSFGNVAEASTGINKQPEVATPNKPAQETALREIKTQTKMSF